MVPSSDKGSDGPNKKRKISYGYVPYPAIGFQMGGRPFCITAMTPVDYVGVVGPREEWDPLSGVGTNRKEDKAHRDAIASYIQDTPDYVLNSILLYISEHDAHFVADDDNNQVIRSGVLYVRPGAKFKVGDGGHRTSAYGDVITAHEPLNDEVIERLRTSGQPIVVVIDDDQVRRAQDFSDLQKNAKPLNASIAQSMDRRQVLNRLLIEEVIKAGDVAGFDQGARIEFLTDTPGKLSAKLMSFKAMRYASGTLLIGTSARTTRTWNDAVETTIARVGEEAATGDLIEFWSAYCALPRIAEGLSRERGLAVVREETWLLSANVIYAIAAAVHIVRTEDEDLSIADAVSKLESFDFEREGRALIGTLVDPETGKAATGRDAWGSAAVRMAEHVLPGLKSQAGV
ncbi:DNA sulfur modification protein DndB [Amycolatopsis suaedae]|uniref:DGQHR domain-containing protein n=1 Tax=Amycolatopsis suaedae TaxID=2510978 RepID=A0A4Q7J3C9_9PSEU|nr:DNA sulfur modification protein DndB [Amycolatopsis suaedae]RZQ61990.1 DGQHR domain-containing protein [Amycolatopsis suaedae]